MASETPATRQLNQSPKPDQVPQEKIPEGSLAAVMAARELVEEKIPEGGLEALRRQHLAEEKIPEGGLAGLKKSEVLLDAVGLTKSYLGTEAIRDVSFKLKAGEIFGLVGPNGAGKTTLLRVLATLTQPDSGQATIGGYSLDQVQKVRGLIGFMSDVLGVYDDMLVGEYLEFFARASKLPDATRDFSVQETLELIGLDHVAERPVDGLSRGMKQRLALGRAILHKPKLLLLDEPASGLDPLARLDLRRRLHELCREGSSILISSHVLEDLADICDRIGVMSNGLMVCVEETARLISDRGQRSIRVESLNQGEELYRYLQGRNDIVGLQWDNRSLIFSMEGAEPSDLAVLLKEILGQGIDLVAFGEEEPNLETAYRNVTTAGRS